MRHRKDTLKLSRSHSHRRALMSNLVTSLFKYEKIQTTFPKAQASKRVAEHLISISKQNDLAAIRQVGRVVKDKDVLKKLFQVIMPRMKDKNSGFITVTKLWLRKGDAALLCLMELYGAPAKAKLVEGEKKEKKVHKPTKKQPGKKSASAKASSSVKTSADKPADKVKTEGKPKEEKKPASAKASADKAEKKTEKKAEVKK
jgi:large subunit ribosomal protein L17